MLLLVYGAEPFLVRQRVQEIKEQELARGALVQDVDCKEEDMKEVFSSLNTPSLFSQKKLVVFHSAFGAKEWEQKEFTQALLKTGLNTYVFAAGELKKADPLAALLFRHGETEEFPKLIGAKLAAWVKKECKKNELSLAPGAGELLLSLAKENLERLSREIAKLAAFKRFAAHREASKEDVLLLVPGEEQPNIFSTIDAIGAKDQKTATRLLARHLAAGQEPLQLLGTLAWQVRTLLCLKDLQERKVSQQEIARKLKLHPFVAQKSFIAAQHFPLEELKELYRRIFALDLGFKTGRGNPDQLLLLFAARAAAKEKQPA